MALSKIDAANFLTGTIPSGNISTSSLAAAATGKVLQVVQTVKTDTDSTTATSFNDISGMSVAITPAATSSKILVFANTNTGETINYSGSIQLMRDTTALFIGDASSSRTRASAGGLMPNGRTSQQRNIHYLDSPSSTSALTYKLQWLAESGGTLYLNRDAGDADAAYSTRAASSITVMEIAG
jgi:hypothetical protein